MSVPLFFRVLIAALFGLLLAGCPENSGQPRPQLDDDDSVGDDDDTWVGDDDDDDDDTGPVEQPQDVDPCAHGVCWETSLAVQRCHTGSEDEDFSTGNYNVHAWRSSAEDEAETRIRLTRTGGGWNPALIVRDLDGRTLSDGEVGLMEAGLDVQVVETGMGGDVADVWITTDTAMAIDVFVTGWGAVDSGFDAYQPTDATYTLQIESVCETPPLDCSGPTVNGNPVAEPACGWLEYVAREVVPALAGSRDERLELASIVAWWSLKEGVMFLDNPIVYSNCAFESGSEYIDPLETCPSGRAWQVGLSGIQVPTFLDDRPNEQAAILYPTLTEDEVLELTAADALLSGSDTAGVVASTGALRTSWLLRNSAIGFTLQVDLVQSECIVGSYDWCYGSGWTATALYAPDKDGALQSMDDIYGIFDELAP